MSSTQAEQSPAPTTPPPSKRPSLKELISRYGKTAGIVYLVLCVVTFIASFVTVRYFGWKPQSAVGEAGLWTVTYVGYKLLQPLRLIALPVLLPLVVKLTPARKIAPAAESPDVPRPD